MVAPIIGIVAATASVVAFLPQAWRIIKTRNTKDLSTPMWILQTCGFAAWIAYGIEIGQWPVIAPNVLTFTLSLFILVMQLVSSSTRDKIADKLDPEK